MLPPLPLITGHVTNCFPMRQIDLTKLGVDEKGSFYTPTYLYALRTIEIHLVPKNPSRKSSISWDTLNHLYLLHIKLLLQLIGHSLRVYKNSLSLVFQETYLLPTFPSQQCSIEAPGSTKQSSWGNTFSSSYPEDYFPRPPQTASLRIPEWISRSPTNRDLFLNGLLPQSGVHLDMHTEPLSPIGRKMETLVYLNAHRGNSVSQGSKLTSFANYSMRPGTVPLSPGKLYQTPRALTNDRMLHFFFATQRRAWQLHKNRPLLPTHLSWKLGLREFKDRATMSLVDLLPTPACEYYPRPPRDPWQRCSTVFWDTTVSLTHALSRHTWDPRADAGLSNVLLQGHLCFLRPSRSPIVSHRYELVQWRSTVFLPSPSKHEYEVELECLWQAAIRGWSLTHQGNPFGKITNFGY